jgi:hypothetical protein
MTIPLIKNGKKLKHPAVLAECCGTMYIKVEVSL